MSITRSAPSQIQGFTNLYSMGPKLIGYSWKQISYGDYHVLGITSNNKLYAWGLNNNGQLGSSDTINRSSPTQIGTEDWSYVYAGVSSSSGIKTNGLLHTWGINTDGQLGLLDIINRSSPAQIGTSSWTSVSAGLNHMVAIRSDSTLWSWGKNDYGQLGRTDYLTRSSPVQIGTSSYIQASAGSNFTTALANDYTVWNFGDNTQGQLGLTAVSDTKSWAMIAGNSTYSVGIDTNGLLYSWGSNASGQLGLNDTLPRSSPVQIGSDSWVFVSVEAGSSTPAAIRSDGTLWSWGYNVEGQIGIGDRISRSSPVQISGGGSWTTVSAGFNHKLAIKSDGTLWGVGNGSVGPSLTGYRSFATISSGLSYTLAIDTGGKLWSWGSGTSGVLGTGDTISRSSPVQIGSDTNWSKVYAAYTTSLAIKTDGSLWAWGSNASYGYGDNTSITRSSPIQINTGLSWTMLAGNGDGSTSIFGITNVGGLYAWGGSYGFNDTISRSAPTQITSPSASWIFVDGIGSVGAITTAYRLYMTGTNAENALGNGGASPRAFVEVTNGGSWSFLSSSGQATHAIKTDGTLWGWGRNNNSLALPGSNGTPTTIVSPVQIGTATNWKFVSNKSSDAVIVAAESSGVYTYSSWGANPNGQLGVGDTSGRGNITQIYMPTLASPIQVVLSYDTALILAGPSNTLYGWGLNTTGQLGAGYILNRSAPIQVGTQIINRSFPVQIAGYSYTQVVAGNYFSAAIDKDGKLWTSGYNNNGVLGVGDTVVSRQFFTNVGTSSWANIFSGASSLIALSSSNYLYSWGVNTTGILGLNDTINRSSPVQVSTTKFSKYALQSAGATDTALALDTLGGLWGWGSKTNKLLGEFANTSYTYSWSTISTGLSHTVAIRNDGRLYTWGLNSSGQLGFGDTISRSSPTQLGSTDNDLWLTASAGGNRTYAIRSSDNVLYAWGSNASFELGDGTSVARSSPVQVAPAVSKVSAGISHAVAIYTNNLLYGWGSNAQGQLGLSDTLNRSFPIQIGSSSWTQISAGGSHTAAIAPSGGLYTWGANDSGQLGLTVTTNRSSPVQVGTSSYVLVSAGDKHTMVIDSQTRMFGFGNNQSFQLGVTDLTNLFQLNNTGVGFIKQNDYALWLWGSNDVGQLGTSDTITRSSPTQIGATESYTIVARAQLATAGHTLAIRSNGSLWAWGSGVAGKLGLNDTLNRSSPTQVGTSSWLQVASGVSHSLAIKSDGTLWGWGLNSSGQAGILSWAQVSSGNSHTLALRSDGQLFGYGLNSSGQLGLTDTLSRSSPTQVGTGNVFTRVAAGQNISVAIRQDGGLFTWGSNANGALGINSTINRSSPVQVGTSSWSQVSAADYVLALDSGNILYGWGLNSTYQLITSDTLSRSSPVQLAAENSFTFVSAGTNHALVLDPNNKMYAWGTNTNGQLGVTVPNSDFGWKTIYNGDIHSLYVHNDGSLWASGYGGQGNLGIGDTFDRSSPVQVGTGFDWDKVTVPSDNGYFGLAIKQNGTLWTWGNNTFGQLGIGNIIDRSSPVQVGGSWTMTAGGVYYSYGIKTDGTLWSWGRATTGSLGLGNNISRSSPVQIGTSSWTYVTTGAYTGLAIRADGTLWGWGANGGVGILLTGDTLSRSSPVQVGTESGWKYAAIHKTGNFAFAIKTTGELWGWGINTVGQLGDGTTDNRSSPVQIASDKTWDIVYTDTTYVAAAGQTSDSRLWQWGAQSVNGLGSAVNSSSPYLVGTSYSFVLASSAYYYNNLLWNNWPTADNTQTLITWGTNNYGRLGRGNVTSTSSPVVTTATVPLGYLVKVGNSSWTAVSAGNQHSLAIKSDGTLFVWGLNSSAQLGFGAFDFANRSSPTQLGTSSWSNVYAGNSYSMAKDSTGSLFAWGTNLFGQTGIAQPISWTRLGAPLALQSNSTLWAVGSNANGELGNNSLVTRSSPIQVGTSSWTYIASTDNTRFGIEIDNTLYAWGLNTSGQLGLADLISRSSPTQIAGSWSVIAASGTGHSLAIKSDGTLWSWGTNTYGELGVQDTIVNINRSSPTQVGSASWKTVAAGNNFSLGINANNQLQAWGRNDFGQLGTSVPYSWTVITNGASHTAAIRNDGRLYTWGLNSSGQLGLNDTINRSSPVQLGTSSWSQVAAGLSHTVGIAANGTLWTWGRNNSGQLGQADTINRSNPTQLGNSSGYTLIAPGRDVTFAYNSTSFLVAMGDNSLGTLGLNDTINRSSPVQVDTSTYTSIDSSGTGHTLAIRSGGSLWAWGNNANNELGLASDSTLAYNPAPNRSSPVQVSAGTSFTQVSAGYSFSAAIASTSALYTWGLNTSGQAGIISTIPSFTGINTMTIYRTDGKAYTWGGGTNGQLGDGTAVSKSTPTLISSSNSWTIVTYGNNNRLALRQDGLLFAWGQNISGQLGDGTAIPRSSPVQIGTSSWIAVAAGNASGYGILSNYTVFAWGIGNNGALGLGDTINRSSPVQISSLPSLSWTTITASTDSAYVVASDGTAYGWGNNVAGQLGIGDTVTRSNPVQLNLTNVSKISAGISIVGAINTSGQLYTWGLNNNGQLGINTITNRSNPTQVTTPVVSWSQIAAGGAQIYGIDTLGKLYSWGSNSNGALGGSSTVALASTAVRSTPVQIGPAGSSFTQVYAWYPLSSAYAFTTAKTVFSWGYNGTGELGDGTTLNRSAPVQLGATLLTGQMVDIFKTPTQVGGLWSRINAGNGWTLAADTLLQGYTWGAGTNGELGNSTTLRRSSPVQLGAQIVTVSGKNNPIIINGVLGLFSWGNNNAGQLGDLTILSRSSPVTISGATAATGIVPGMTDSVKSPTLIGTSSWISIGAGDAHAGAITNPDLGLFTWGKNDNGQLGSGTTLSRSSPVQVGTSSWSSISAGNSFTVGINLVASLFAWGLNSSGQLGISLTTSRSSPVQVFTAAGIVSAGSNYVYATENTLNRLYSWGNNTNGQLGLGDVVARSSPVQIGTTFANTLYSPVAVGSSSWASVSTGSSQSVLIRSDWSMWATGNNAQGQIGSTDTISRSSPTQIGSATLLDSRSSPVQIDSGSWSYVTAGQDYSIAIRSNGTLWAWGINTNGYLGDGTTITRSYPIQISGSYTWVNSGGSHAVAIRSDYSLWTWGLNNAGQLGNNNRINRSSPVQVSGSWTTVSAGNSHSIGLDTSGTTYTWGLNSSGQLGLGITLARSNPVQISSASLPFNSIFAGPLSSYGSTTNNILYGWGDNTAGAVGDGTVTNKSVITALGLLYTTKPAYSSPTQIGTFTNESWSLVAAGGSNTYAVATDYTIYSWGNNAYGQGGDSTTINKFSPTQIPANTSSYTQISAGYSHTELITATGLITSVGLNNAGQLGTIDAVNRSTPIQVFTSTMTSPLIPIKLNTVRTSSYTQIQSGQAASAVRIDGLLFTWGTGTSGQLGTNSVVSRSSPALVGNQIQSYNASPTQLGTSSWSQVSAGYSHATAINANGSLFGWGAAIANGQSTAVSSPVQIGTSSWLIVASGNSVNSAIDTNYNLYAWGDNSLYKAGIATLLSTSNTSSPVVIGKQTSWTSIGLSGGGAQINSPVGISVPDAPTLGTPYITGPGYKIAVPFAYNKNYNSPFISITLTRSPGNVSQTIYTPVTGIATFTDAAPNTSYTFTAYATTLVGNSSNSNTTSPINQPDIPGAPTIGTATLTATGVDITFTAPASNGGSTILSYTAVSSPGGITGSISQSGSGTVSVTGLSADTNYTFTVYATNIVGDSASSSSSNSVLTGGQVAYTTPGTYTWVVPANVSSISVVAVGGGGGGFREGGGGGGGGLGYKNNIAVTPGQSYTIVVGAGGSSGTSATAGSISYFNTSGTVSGSGGAPGTTTGTGATGGTYVGDGGGNGGSGGGWVNASTLGLTGNNSGGGGGAGGYNGTGGAGASCAPAGGGTGGAPATGSGGGGGGAAVTQTLGNGNGTPSAGAGGGVGILGLGADGVGGTGSAVYTIAATGGSGGSGGAAGTNGTAFSSQGNKGGTGGAYGGGAGGSNGTFNGGGYIRGDNNPGGDGAVRIIWPGVLRQFPSTGAANSFQ